MRNPHGALWLSLGFWPVGTALRTILQSLNGLLPNFVHQSYRKIKNFLAAICDLLGVEIFDGQGDAEVVRSGEKGWKFGKTPENQEFAPWVIPNVNKCCFQQL